MALGVLLAIQGELSPVLGYGFRAMSDVLQPIPPAVFVPMAVVSLGLTMALRRCHPPRDRLAACLRLGLCR